jgi:Uma2 family endonuclease
MDKILKPILKSPLLPDYVAQLSSYLQVEAKRRKAFYNWLDEDTRAEFIDGEIIIHSPAREVHSLALDNLGEQIKAFVVKNNLGLVRKEQALVRMKRSDVMPDLLFFENEKAKHIKLNTKLYPIPDFVVEIVSPSTEQNDRKRKYVEYALNGVTEYWIVDADKKEVEQYLLIGNEYKLRKKLDELDTIECIVLEGLYIEVSSIFNERESQLAMLKIMAGKA